MAVWMVSNCRTQSRRENILRSLQRYIPVDVYGSCGKKKCGTRTTIPHVNKLGNDPCEEVIKKYSFYIAFENALCEDYVTEKLYRSLKLGVIPVVLGGANYTLFAPPNSFIDVQDFSTIDGLAKHLKKVSADSTLYNEYLKWQEHYDIEIGSPYNPLICDLCKKLHQQHRTRYID